jgi:probable phosphoglycerate mutase
MGTPETVFNEKRMRYLYLVRHGQTEWNSERRIQGQLDSPLTEVGRGHAEANRDLLASEGVEHLVASPLGRTRETTEIINAGIRVDVAFDPRLMERHYGDWCGLTTIEIETRFPEAWAARDADPYRHRPPNGESLPDLVARAAPLFEVLLELPFERVAVVSHGGTGRAALAHFLGLGSEIMTIRQPNDAVYRLDFADGEVRCHHFRSGQGPSPGFID